MSGMTDVADRLDALAAECCQTTDGDYLARLANGHLIASDCADFIREHGAEIAARLRGDGEQGQAALSTQPAPSEQAAGHEMGPDTHGCDHAITCGFCRAERSMAASVAVPEGLIHRVEEAARRIESGHAPRRIPADPTDVDLVLGEVLAWLKGEPAPFWVPAAAPVAPINNNKEDNAAH